MDHILMRSVMIVRYVLKWPWLISLWHSLICLHKHPKSKNRCPNPGLPDVKAIRHHFLSWDLQDWVTHFLGGLYCLPAHNHEPFGWGASTICGEVGCGGGIIVTWYQTREGRVDENRNNGRREDNRVYVGRERLRKIIVTLSSNQCCHHDANSTETTRDFFRGEIFCDRGMSAMEGSALTTSACCCSEI